MSFELPICSVTSTKPSIVFSDGLPKSVAGFSRSQPFCLPYSENILGFGKYRHRSMHWFIISLISRISHCFRRHTKVIILEAEGKALRIQLRNRHIKVVQGDTVALYLADTTKVFHSL